MLCLHYRSEGERAQALASLARRCRELDGRVAFLASEDACEQSREAVRQIEPALLSSMSFSPLCLVGDGAGSDQAWARAAELVRSALRETCTIGSPLVAWVESAPPRSTATTGRALQTYHQAIDALTPGVVPTVISAFRLADDERDLLAWVDGPNVLVAAEMIGRRCPTWLVPGRTPDPASESTVPTHSDASDPLFTPRFQAEKLAALGQLAAGVAHELGNPLSIISSSLQYLHQRFDTANDPASDFTATALQNVERMHGLLRNMLDFAAVKKPSLDLVDLNEAVSDVLRFTSAERDRCSVGVAVSYDPTLPKAWVDPGGVKQILLNLVMNALHAITLGGDTIRLSLRRGPSQAAVVEIDNNGPAIPAAFLQELFRPFHTTKHGGTGLGLYLSRQIARDHGGDLVAENLPNGVRFILTLPLDRRKAKDHGEHPDRRR
jgi:signal transduction histidine kinase